MSTNNILDGIRWGTIEKKECKDDKRKYASICWDAGKNIGGRTTGTTWEEQCKNLPAKWTEGKPNIISDDKVPDWSGWAGTNIWGEWYVDDQECTSQSNNQPYWGDWEDKGCIGENKKAYEARIMNITGSWDDACDELRLKPITNGPWGDKPYVFDPNQPCLGGALGGKYWTPLKELGMWGRVIVDEECDYVKNPIGDFIKDPGRVIGEIIKNPLKPITDIIEDPVKSVTDSITKPFENIGSTGIILSSASSFSSISLCLCCLCLIFMIMIMR